MRLILSEYLNRRPAEVSFAYTAKDTKEASIMALGEGLPLSIDSFDVTLGPGFSAHLLRVAPPQKLSRWKMHDISAPQGYSAAVVE